MKSSSPFSNSPIATDNPSGGFTLVEILVAIVVASLMAMGIVIHYVAQNKAYAIQRERAHMQQNLRAAMHMLKNDIRNSGADIQRTGKYGIASIQRYNPANPAQPLVAGIPGLDLTGLQDNDGDGMVDESAPEQTIQYRVWDQNGDGRLELHRQTCTGTCTAPGNWQLVIDGVEDIGFAFAYDDGSGDLARAGGNPAAAVIWAIDNDNGNNLDTSLDSDADGDITINDNLQGLGTAIELRRIRAVRIWLLARSRQAYQDYTDASSRYAMGYRIFDLSEPANANSINFRHWLLSGVVALNNYEMDPEQ